MNEKSYSESYKAAGVDITAGYRAVELMKSHIARTKNEGCLDDIGGFGGLFGLNLKGYEEPVLVSGTDGVGTKLRLAFLMDRHHTVGIDCVAMCVNDVICCGAKPLFFLDYIACGKNVPERIAELVSGVAEGCVQAGCALIGGETAEMPGFYPEDEYDLAGFSVGIVDKKKIVDHSAMIPEMWSLLCPPPVCTPTGSPWCGRSLIWNTVCNGRRPGRSWAASLPVRRCWFPPRSMSSLCWRSWIESG